MQLKLCSHTWMINHFMRKKSSVEQNICKSGNTIFIQNQKNTFFSFLLLFSFTYNKTYDWWHCWMLICKLTFRIVLWYTRLNKYGLGKGTVLHKEEKIILFMHKGKNITFQETRYWLFSSIIIIMIDEVMRSLDYYE